MGLVPEHHIQTSLFQDSSDVADDILTQLMDEMNGKFGKNKIKLATVGNREKEWALIKEHRSPRYTTQWNELLTIGSKTKS